MTGALGIVVLVVVLVVVLSIVIAVVVQLPEIRRYMKIRSM